MDSFPLPRSFKLRSEAAVQTDPLEQELFIGPSDDELGDGHVASLVWEWIQNANDARAGSEPVRVPLAFHSAKLDDINFGPMALYCGQRLTDRPSRVVFKAATVGKECAA